MTTEEKQELKAELQSELVDIFSSFQAGFKKDLYLILDLKIDPLEKSIDTLVADFQKDRHSRNDRETALGGRLTIMETRCTMIQENKSKCLPNGSKGQSGAVMTTNGEYEKRKRDFFINARAELYGGIKAMIIFFWNLKGVKYLMGYGMAFMVLTYMAIKSDVEAVKKLIAGIKGIF